MPASRRRGAGTGATRRAAPASAPTARPALDGAVLWEGPSEIDGGPILLVASNLTGTRVGSHLNRKTGDTVATWILRQDVSPFDALKSRADVSICGTCPLRPQGPPGTMKMRACYVHPGMADNIWQAWRRGRYQRIADLPPEPLGGRVVRLGSYGDPAALPRYVLDHILSGTRGHLGYTHAWRRRPDLKDVVMASVDSPEEQEEARTAGWRTFRTRLADERLLPGEIVCPASAEGGRRTTCLRCQLCDGAHARRGVRDGDPRRSIAIIAHGWNSSTGAYKRLRRANEQARLQARLPIIP